MRNSRRSFLLHSLGATVGTMGPSSLLGRLGRVAMAVPQSTDYRALVCVFLYGGNDSDNTLIPYGTQEYNAYASARSVLAIPRTNLLSISPLNTDGRQWALHPNLGGLQTLFQQQKLAIVANVGVLLAPTTRTQYLNGTATLPPQLFSHTDQQAHWQTSWSDQPVLTGWGGRLADRLNSLNTGTAVSMNISLDGTNVFQVGQQIFPYMISSEGAIPLWYYDEAWGNPETVVTKSMLEAPTTNLFETAYRTLFRRAIDNARSLNQMLSSAPALTTTFPQNVTLADQLKMVARLISLRQQLGMRRQIFFCSAGGYDTHGGQINTQAALLGQLSQSLSAFYQATVELGVASQVTTFTASDFGRTYKSNGKGSDHGWGSHQLVIGGAVRGGDIYGQVPVLQVDGPNDTSDGRWIPTIATDEFAATLALWFGAQAGDLPSILPNINRFSRSNLGFLNG